MQISCQSINMYLFHKKTMLFHYYIVDAQGGTFLTRLALKTIFNGIPIQ